MNTTCQRLLRVTRPYTSSLETFATVRTYSKNFKKKKVKFPIPAATSSNTNTNTNTNTSNDANISVDTSGLYSPQLHTMMPDFDNDKSYEPSTKLFEYLKAYIGLRGPISVAEYMRQALMHPQYGYYSCPPSALEIEDEDEDDDIHDVNNGRTVIGKRGDFTTAPEISQIFGELLCIFFIHEWYEIGQPKSIQLIELGPGNGTLMKDMLRTAQTFPEFWSALKKGGIKMIEQSNSLRKTQADTLGVLSLKFEDLGAIDVSENIEALNSIEPYLLGGNILSKDEAEIPISWHLRLDTVSTSPDLGPQFMVAQELFDALPVHSFQKSVDGWRERLVDVASVEEEEVKLELGAAESKDGAPNNKLKPRLRFVLSKGTTKAVRSFLRTDNRGYVKGEAAAHDDAFVGDVLEVCPDGMALVQDMAKRIDENGGAALIIDYGSIKGTGDSIRGFRKHKQVHCLSSPGEVDVTADVDFVALENAVKQNEGQITCYGTNTQGNFLLQLGGAERLEKLIDDESTTDEQAQDLFTAFERLVLPEHMGERYKVMGLGKRNRTHAPPGFRGLL